MMKKACVISFLSLLFTNSVFGQIYVRLHSREEILQKKLHAVLEVRVVDQKGELVSLGTGFFFNKDGTFVTSQHVVEPWFKKRQLKLFFKRYGSIESYKDVELVKCSDERNIDLCFFRVMNYKPPEYFKVPSSPPKKGHEGQYIGHCRGLYTGGKGIFEREYESVYEYITAVKILGEYRPVRNKNVKIVQMRKLDHCPGDSGGPLFGNNGELWGVTSEIITFRGTGEKMYLFLSGKEVANLSKKIIRAKKIPANRIHHVRQIRTEDYYKMKEKL